MEQLITDRLRDNLSRLNLNRAAEVLFTPIRVGVGGVIFAG